MVKVIALRVRHDGSDLAAAAAAYTGDIRGRAWIGCELVAINDAELILIAKKLSESYGICTQLF